MSTTDDNKAMTAAERKRLQRERDQQIRFELIGGKMRWHDAPDRVLFSFIDNAYSVSELPDQARAAWLELGRRRGWL